MGFIFSIHFFNMFLFFYNHMFENFLYEYYGKIIHFIRFSSQLVNTLNGISFIVIPFLNSFVNMPLMSATVSKKWLLMEEAFWRQKSREIWSREGDKNIGFFHRMANAHKRSNLLRKIKISGVWCTEENEIQEGVARAFQNLLLEPGDWHPSLAGLDFD